MTQFSPFGENLFGEPAAPVGETPLSREFICPPFTILDTTSKRWQERKRAWMALGLRSELGRGEDLLNLERLQNYSATRREADLATNLTGAAELPEWANNGTTLIAPGTSIFDPVLCELLYRWFAAPGYRTLDPFAGGSVRGIIGALLGHEYEGIELREEQVASNYEQAREITPGRMPTWIVGDSFDVLDAQQEQNIDFILSCPPYADLEVYSENPADLSVIASQDYHAFVARYRHIIYRAARRLRNDRFAAFVVGDVRDRRGHFRNFVSDTIAAFENAGLRYYNDAVLVNAVGTLALRTGKTFRATRKLGRQHQNVLVFVKGDARKATRAIDAATPAG
jgi:hypothetical protein